MPKVYDLYAWDNVQSQFVATATSDKLQITPNPIPSLLSSETSKFYMLSARVTQLSSPKSTHTISMVIDRMLAVH